ncbi:uncharacterized protein LOC131668719 [Phymastichus coffea]|uniref:uncharacterized protein LOC131668719 n=1 Tax=Phymastichus coffea TaxID=108790 RepID=UPI00273CBBE8|nr:uncharacterized protein LOC131668719 [Phymastichus coffea]
MSASGIGKKCACCGLPEKKLVGPKQTVDTDDEAYTLSDYLAVTLVMGDILCQKCSGSARFAKAKRRKIDQPQNVNTLQIDSQGSTSSSETLSQPHNDTVYVPPKKKVIEKAKDTIELPLKRVVSTHDYCCLCKSKTNIVIVPFDARKQAFVERDIFIPEGNRCCRKHLIKKRFYSDELINLKVVSNSTTTTAADITKLFKSLSLTSDRELHDRIGDFSISEERIRTFTGLNWEQLIESREMMVSLRNTDNRTVTQAVVVFLFRLRTGNSNEIICSVLGLDRHQQVSEFSKSVLSAFEKDVLPSRFGLQAVNREDLIANNSTILLQKLHGISDNNLSLVGDGTYLKHQKSSNNEYQRRSFSGHKKVPLCKPFTLCTTTGFIVDVLGPFYAKENDSMILEKILKAHDNNLKNLMCKEGDVFILDRGFRDIKSKLENDGYRVLMPALKDKNQKQLSAEDANKSRLVTILRWVVEAVHGAVAQKYKFFHEQLDNRYLTEAGLYCRIVCFLINQFGKRIVSRASTDNEILNYILSRNSNENSLATEVISGKYSRRKSLFKTLRSDELEDFPEMTEQDLVKLFTGTYQLKQAISYLAEMMGDTYEINVSYYRESADLIKLQVRSRHIESKQYNCYIHYKPNTIGCAGILRFCCECANGMRTIGCCSHVAAVIYYLAHARFQSSIVKPAQHLTKIYEQDHVVAVIEADSDDD